MQSARRLASLTALGLIGTLALTGCRSQPGAAIYIGSASYSETYVNELADQMQKVPGISRGAGRERVAEFLVVRDLGKLLTADKNWSAPQVDEQAATTDIEGALQSAGRGSSQDLQSVRPLIKLYAEYQAYRGVVEQHATPAQLTDADYAELYQRYKAAGLLPPNIDEVGFRKNLPQQDQQLIEPNLGVRQLYSEEIHKADVKVNPKYGLTELPLLQTQSGSPIVSVPLRADQPAVVPAAPQPQTASNG